jgi:hypothetical protein
MIRSLSQSTDNVWIATVIYLVYTNPIRIREAPSGGLSVGGVQSIATRRITLGVKLTFGYKNALRLV